MRARALIFHMSIPCDKTFFLGFIIFETLTLTLEWGIFLKTLTLLITLEHWVLELSFFSWIFPVNRSFCWYLTFWPWHLTFFLKIDIGHNLNIGAFILHVSISCDKIFLLVSRYLSSWPWKSLELAIIRGHCVSQTHLVFVNLRPVMKRKNLHPPPPLKKPQIGL